MVALNHGNTTMQPTNIQVPYVCRYRNSTGMDRVHHNANLLTNSCSGWPVIRGDHKTPNEHSYSFWKTGGRGVYRHIANDGWWEVDVGCVTSFSLDDSSIAYNNALSQVVEKARGGLDLTVDAAQAGQNIRMMNVFKTFMSYAQNFRGGWRSNRFGRFRKGGLGKGSVKSAGQAWLEYIYGWKPLVDDIYAAADESLRFVLNRYSTIEGHGLFKDTRYLTMDDGTNFVGRNIPVQIKNAVTIVLTLDNQKTMDISRWGSLNPISIGWELMPYSFVVDWFFNVGQFLRNAETALLYGSAVSDGYVSNLRVAKMDPWTGGKIGSGPGYVQTTEGNWYATRLAFQRSRLKTFPVPGKIPLKTDLSQGHFFNAAALLTQFIR